MKEIKFTISGLRGIWGTELTTQTAERYIDAYIIYLQKRNARKIIIGRDARVSGPTITDIVKRRVTEAGIDIVDIGIAPTPTVIYLVRTLSLDGGIMVSASHNPREYNGIKFLNNKALYIDQTEVDEVKSYLGNPIEKAPTPGTYEYDPTLGEKHVEHILAYVDVEKIREKMFRVVLDPINSSGYLLGPLLLEKLGCTPIVINGFATGDFAHIPEPLPENLTSLGEKVTLFKAHIGFALDPDADRLVVCDDTGTVVFEEYTLSLAIKRILEREKTDIVINLSTSNTNEDLALLAGVKTHRTAVGEMNVVRGMTEHGAAMGGEGGGGVIYEPMNLCRDSLAGMALILELLATSDKTSSDIVAMLPKWEFVKTKIPFSGSFEDVKKNIVTLFPEAVCDTRDGLRFDFPDRSWVQIRASNTEPIIRVFAEGKDKPLIEQKIHSITACL